MAHGRPILVSGMPRSGSNLLGWCLEASGQVRMLNEVCRPAPKPTGAFAGWPIPRRYTALPGPGEADIERALRPLVELRPPWWNLGHLRTPRDAAQWLRFSGALSGSRVRGHRLLLKDTSASALAGWFAGTFDADVVVILRHPAGLAAGLKRIGWRFDGSHLVSQPALQPVLAPIWDRLVATAGTRPDAVDSATLLWSSLVLLLAPQLEAHREWEVVEYEDLALEPWSTVSRVAGAIGLDTPDAMRAKVRELTEGENIELAPSDRKNRPARDSRAAAHSWRQRLDPDEIDAVRRGIRGAVDRWPGAPLTW